MLSEFKGSAAIARPQNDLLLAWHGRMDTYTKNKVASCCAVSGGKLDQKEVFSFF